MLCGAYTQTRINRLLRACPGRPVTVATARALSCLVQGIHPASLVFIDLPSPVGSLPLPDCVVGPCADEDGDPPNTLEDG